MRGPPSHGQNEHEDAEELAQQLRLNLMAVLKTVLADIMKLMGKGFGSIPGSLASFSDSGSAAE